nr:hypothetical protein [Tanacetum cinerariifolium]
HGQAQLSLESIEAYDPEAEAKYVTALQASKDLKYPLVDQLEGLKDAPIDVIMAALNPWAYKEEMLLADAIEVNISRAEKKKKFRIVCRTHGVGSAHHARSDGIPVSVPTMVLQGLAILLADAATQMELEEATLVICSIHSAACEDMLLAKSSHLLPVMNLISNARGKGANHYLANLNWAMDLLREFYVNNIDYDHGPFYFLRGQALCLRGLCLYEEHGVLIHVTCLW